MESIAFRPNGETHRRISWDFTLPDELAVSASSTTVAVPLATLRKRPLRRLDVRSADGAALPVWGRQSNGDLAKQRLVAGLSGTSGFLNTGRTNELLDQIVYASPDADLSGELTELFQSDTLTVDIEAADVLQAIAEELVVSFVFVVELPLEVIGRRTIVKASYDDDRTGVPAQLPLTGFESIDIEGSAWNEAESWHLEVHAPDGLRITSMYYEAWDPETNDLMDSDADPAPSATAHLAGRQLPRDVAVQAQVTFGSTLRGLLNQATVSALLASLLLVSEGVLSSAIMTRVVAPGRIGSIAAVAFSAPALLVALLGRGSEHELVSRVLLAPRLACFSTALLLWSAGLAIIWAQTAAELAWTAGVLALIQIAVLVWLLSMRTVRPDP